MQDFFREKHYLCPRIDIMIADKLTMMRQKPLLLALCLLMAGALSSSAQEAVIVGPQVTQESDLVEGQPYILQSQATGTPYVADAGTYYAIPNNNKATEACVYRFVSNGEGAWFVQSTYTEKCWSVPTYNQAITPVSLEEAGAWKLNFSGGIAYPTALDAEGTERGLDRSSGKLWGYTKGTGGTKQIKIFELGDVPYSSTPLEELNNKVAQISETAADDLKVGQWYVMFNRGQAASNKHGYLYENVSSHTLYNTATAPAGMAATAARFLVRLSDAGDGRYFVQTGYGNYFGSFTKSTAVPVTSTPKEPIAIEKIADTDGHFYLQSVSTGFVLDANSLENGDATVVGWATEPPTSINVNNDWAFYPVAVEELGEEVAMLAEHVTAKRGYQTTGRGNKDALLLRIDINPLKAMSDVKFTFALDAETVSNISELYLYETSATEFLANIPTKPLASTTDIAETVTLSAGNSSKATHHYWLCATVKEEAALGAVLKAALTHIDYTTTKDVALDVTAVGNPNRQGMKVFALQNFVFVPTTNDCRYYRIPAMILDKNGNLVVAIDKRYGSNADLGNHKIDIVSLRSDDGGATWKQEAAVATGDGSTAAYYGYGDAALALAPNGNLICVMAAGSKRWSSSKDSGMMYAGLAKSSNNGRSWSLTKNLFASTNFFDEVHGTKGSIGFSNIFVTSGKGLTTNDGVIMFTTNCTEMGTTSPALCHILYSTDNGSTWRLSKALAYSGCDESKLEQLNDGSLLLSVRQSGNRGWNKATYTKNDDGTVTFNWVEQFRNGNIWGNACNADILYYSRQSATTPDILLHTYINTGGRESLQLSMSLDGGTSWKDVYNIQPNGSCYSTMQVLPDGTLAILFEDESYSGGNGYAINYVTLTKEQILDMFTSLGGVIPDGVKETPAKSERVLNHEVYNLAGQRLRKPQKGVNIVNRTKIIH